MCGSLMDVSSSPAPDTKGFSGDRPWQDVEVALITTLRALVLAGEEAGLSLSHLPYSDLGGAPGADGSEDHSWEVQWSVATVVNVTYNGQPATEPSWALDYATAGHPAAALDEATSALAPGGVTLNTEDEALLAQWRGWSDPFRDLTIRCSHLPPDRSGVDLTVSRDGRRKSGWAWQIEIDVADDDSGSWPASSWEGDSLPEVVKAVMADERRWAAGLPAGHLLEDALREEADEDPGGASTS